MRTTNKTLAIIFAIGALTLLGLALLTGVAVERNAHKCPQTQPIAKPTALYNLYINTDKGPFTCTKATISCKNPDNDYRWTYSDGASLEWFHENTK